MKYNQLQLNKFINKALEIVKAGKTYEEILEEGKELNKGKKKPKDYKPYYLRFPFENDEQYQIWIKYIEREVKRLNPSITEDKLKIDVSIIDMICSLSQSYLFTNFVAGNIINEQLKTEKL